MKSAKVESKKILKTTKPHRVAGVQVRSGVKAGRGFVNTGFAGVGDRPLRRG